MDRGSAFGRAPRMVALRFAWFASQCTFCFAVVVRCLELDEGV